MDAARHRLEAKAFRSTNLVLSIYRTMFQFTSAKSFNDYLIALALEGDLALGIPCSPKITTFEDAPRRLIGFGSLEQKVAFVLPLTLIKTLPEFRETFSTCAARKQLADSLQKLGSMSAHKM